jgi:phosphoribosylglycinamide formyltransferase 1
MQARIAVLASGLGSNLEVLLRDAVVGPWIALVVSDRERAPALDRARGAGAEAVFVDPGGGAGGERFDDRLLELLRARSIDIVVNAGFMRILGPEVVRAYAGRCLNIHPSLLPSFPGRHAVADAVEWGVKVTGVTVHLVDEQVDHGPIVAQEPVRVHDGDDERSLHARIQQVEHRLYVDAVRALAEGRLRVDGRRVTIAGALA